MQLPGLLPPERPGTPHGAPRASRRHSGTLQSSTCQGARRQHMHKHTQRRTAHCKLVAAALPGHLAAAALQAVKTTFRNPAQVRAPANITEMHSHPWQGCLKWTYTGALLDRSLKQLASRLASRARACSTPSQCSLDLSTVLHSHIYVHTLLHGERVRCQHD